MKAKEKKTKVSQKPSTKPKSSAKQAEQKPQKSKQSKLFDELQRTIGNIMST